MSEVIAHETASVLRARRGSQAVAWLWQLPAEYEIEIVPFDEAPLRAACDPALFEELAPVADRAAVEQKRVGGLLSALPAVQENERIGKATRTYAPANHLASWRSDSRDLLGKEVRPNHVRDRIRLIGNRKKSLPVLQ